MNNPTDEFVAFSMRIHELKLISGERLPIALTDSGVPHSRISLYGTTQLRNAGQTASTMHAALRAICALYAWAGSASIDLEQRIATRRFLSSQEAESLAASLRKGRQQAAGKQSSRRRRSYVEPATSSARIACVSAYVRWLATHVIEARSTSLDPAAIVQIEQMCRLIESRRAGRRGKSTEKNRRGLADDAKTQLAKIIEPGAAANPFRSAVQVRNAVIHDLLLLGLRAGELLCLKVTDFDFQANELVIPRRHGDPEDPRRRQPVAKTNDRRLPLSDELAAVVYGYVLGDRRKTPGASRHRFLLVVHQRGPHLGAPLSDKGLEKAFERIRKKYADLEDLSPHVLRHTANDDFSDVMDASGASPAEEEKMRSYAMGWKEGSGSARIYTRRSTQRKAREAMLAMQKRIFKTRKVDG